MRLDQYLVQLDATLTRARAQDAIQEGRVQVNNKVILKNSFSVSEEDCIELATPELAFASRAGFKLYDVLEDFHIDLSERVCIDVGASTGGFSDVCVREGAKLVYAVDVGKDQLLAHLRSNPRIVNMEGCNCRYLRDDMFSLTPTFACMDVSFISIKLILPSLISIMKSGVEIVALIKPQFEAGKQDVGKNGIIKDEKVHIRVLHEMMDYIQSLGLFVAHLQGSSILGRDGNKEFIVHIVDKEVHTVFPYKEIVKQYKVKR